MARKSASGEEGQARPVAQGAFIIQHDIDGNEVKIPFNQQLDRAKPVPDTEGRIPEFVNVSGKNQQMCVQEQPVDTIHVPPFGILKGEQWRIWAEPNKPYGEHGPFVERVRRDDGTYDPQYLLTEDQVIALANLIISWEFGPARLQMFVDNAKIQEYDKLGRPTRPQDQLMEDRSKVATVLLQRINKLKIEAEKNMQILTGNVMPT